MWYLMRSEFTGNETMWFKDKNALNDFLKEFGAYWSVAYEIEF